MSDTQLKLQKVEIELKVALEQYRNAKGKSKDQAKMKATQLLKKKKMYEGHLNTLSNTQFTVESAKITSDMMRDNMDIVSTLKTVNDQQKSMMKEMNVDTVGDMMDEMRDMMEDQQEINDTLARNYEIDIADDELDGGNFFSKLHKLELEELDQQMRMDLNANDLMVPNKRVLSQKEKDQKILEEQLK